MMVEIPESHRRLLEDKVFAMLGTVMPDGQPQVHPVWVDYDGQYVRVNTARGRQKDENLQRHPQATVLLIDTRSPYFWMEIRGRVVERIEGEEAEAHIDALSYKYTGRKPYANRSPGMVRVLYKIEPTRVLANG
jgi:PPOX class probable F420-dependent enzyme